jgi:hypothetical protein
VVDFTENYTLQPQNEIQIQYYHSEQVSIMVHITYRHRPDSNEQNKVILKEVHFYISDDRSNDLSYVQHCFGLFYEHLKVNNIHMDQQWIWFDGCAGQFKNARVFQWLCMLQRKIKVLHIWNYFETRHGKGEHDGEGAYIKTTLCRQEMKFTNVSIIRDAKSIVEWCSSTMGEGARMQEDQSTRKAHVPRFFWEVVDVNRSQLYECKVIKGTR